MPRFFVEGIIDPSASSLIIAGDDFHHIRDVLRLKPGDELTVCDGARIDLHCRLEKFIAGGVELAILACQPNQTEPPYQAVLYQGLAKGDKMDTIIQKAVELGVSRIVPVQCQRSVVRLDDHDTGKKLLRWNRIAAEAAKQCGRGLVSIVNEPLSFADAVKEAAQADIRLLPWENERACSLRTWLEQLPPFPENPKISLLIGPEGGFSAAEAGLALKADIRPVTLGQRILRTETAGTVVLAMLVYRFNDF